MVFTSILGSPIKQTSARKKPRCVVEKNFSLHLLGKGQRQELLDVPLDFRNAGPRPIRAPEHFVGDLFDPREIIQEFLRRDAGDVHVHILVAADQEESLFHPERAATVGENDGEIRKINADIIAEYGLRVDVPCAGKDRSAGMNHDRKMMDLRALVNGSKRTETVAVGVRRNRLMARMQLERANAESCDAVHFRAGIGDRARVHGAKGQKRSGAAEQYLAIQSLTSGVKPMMSGLT